MGGGCVDQRLTAGRRTAVRGPAPALREVPGGEAPCHEATRYIARFAPSMRVLHWAFAVPFLLLLFTGLTNFWPELKARQLADERLFALIHTVLGFATVGALAVLLPALLARRTSRGDLGDDLRALAHVTVDDYLWLQHHALRAMGARSRPPPVGKFNAGQKLNTLVTAAAALGLFASGVVLGVNTLTKELFSTAFVEDVFPWHTGLSLLIIPVILGHLYLALLHPSTRESLRGMTAGVVRREWAERHHPAWAARHHPAWAARQAQQAEDERGRPGDGGAAAR